MENQAAVDPAVLVLSGMLPFIVIVAIGLACIISILLLWYYKRTVLRYMNRSFSDAGEADTGSTKADSATSESTINPLQSLEVMTIDVKNINTAGNSRNAPLNQVVHRFEYVECLPSIKYK